MPTNSLSPDAQAIMGMTADTIGRDLLSALVTEIKLLPKPWQALSEAKQDDIIERLRDRAAMHESVIPHDDEQRQWRDDMLDAARYLRDCAEAAPVTTVPHGWKLVPIAPTPEMLATTSWPGCAATDYAHMLAAVPQPPSVQIARTLAEWHEDCGPVVWWRFQVDEPAWIGTPLDADWPGYHTHWTPHPSAPEEPTT